MRNRCVLVTSALSLLLALASALMWEESYRIPNKIYLGRRSTVRDWSIESTQGRILFWMMSPPFAGGSYPFKLVGLDHSDPLSDCDHRFGGVGWDRQSALHLTNTTI